MTGQDKGFREKVREIVDNVFGGVTLPDGRTETLDLEDGTGHNEFAEYYTDRIVSLVRELVPEKSTSTCVCDRDACWNDCRTEILSRLEEWK